MQYVRNIPNVNNIGYMDATLRMLVGIALIAPALMQVPHSTWGFVGVSALLSIYPFVTAICRWDPMYQLFDVRSTKETLRQEQIIEAYLEVSRQYVRSLAGTTNVGSGNSAANDESQSRQCA